ncbi:MAG: endolytic transglycosylase MltG [Dehalococcoidia bacterium]
MSLRHLSGPGLIFAASSFAIGAIGVLVAAYFVALTPGQIEGRAVPAGSIPTPGSNVVYKVEEARSAASVGADLQELGVISSGRQFAVLVELMGVAGRLAAGDHLLSRGLTARQAVDALTVKEAGPSIQLTFPEGIRIEEMAEIVDESGLTSGEAFLAAVAAATLPDELGPLPPGAGLQGYLFPDTYILPVGATATELVEIMLTNFATRFDATLRAGLDARGITLHEAVTLASIVEREAVIPEERPLIAGVFYNRIAEGDLLGADPTVQFAVTLLDPLSVNAYGWWKRELTLEDLELDSPYNTRKYAGIPPGPITNPGLASLAAVVQPAETDFYYFVADAKKADGSHVFAVSLAEHLRNVDSVGQP